MKKVILSLILALTAAVSVADSFPKDPSKWHYVHKGVYKGADTALILIANSTKVVTSGGVAFLATPSFIVEDDDYLKVIWAVPRHQCAIGRGSIKAMMVATGNIENTSAFDFNDKNTDVKSDIARAICAYGVGGPPPKR